MHPKPSCSKFALATRRFKRKKGFVQLKIEIWCMDLAYVVKLAKDINSVKSLTVRQNLFDRSVDAKGMKTKDSKGMVRAFLIIATEKNRPQKNWVDKQTDFSGEFEKLCKAEEIQFFCTMS